MNGQTTAADPDLLTAYATQRNADAFAELVKRYGAMVYGVGLRITGSSEDAQDVAQECFLQLAAQAKRIALPLPAWLHTLARSRAMDVLRRRSTRQRHERQASRPEGAPLSLQEWEALLPQVDESIEALDNELRLPLIGLYLQGRTQQELADSLGISQGTISRRIERALEQLRDRLRQAGVNVPAVALGPALGLLGTDLPAELSTNLAKMGLSGLGGRTAPSLARMPWSAAGIAAIVAVTAGLTYWFAGGTQMTTAPTGGTTLTAASTAPQGARVQRQGGRVWIEGLAAGQRDTNPYSQGLSIILQRLGHEDADYIRVMGYSGVAFALQMDLSGPIRDGKYDVAWWPNDSYAFDLRIDFLGQAFGRELRKINCDPKAYDSDFRRVYREQFEPAVVEAIDAGRPVLGQSDAANVIYGYDSTRGTITLLWPSPGQPVFGPANDGYPWGITVPGEAIAPLPQAQAELESLRWAVALWDETAAGTVKDRDTSNLLTGSKAYAKWLELLQQQKDGVGLGRDAWDNNLVIHLRYNRAAAVEYLDGLAQRHAAASAHLRAAADLYQQALDELMVIPFWSQSGDKVAGLEAYTQTIRQTAQREAQAIDHIRQAIPLIDAAR
jgi:RNA polymerase sigma factor (sigma-70 family)